MLKVLGRVSLQPYDNTRHKAASSTFHNIGRPTGWRSRREAILTTLAVVPTGLLSFVRHSRSIALTKLGTRNRKDRILGAGQESLSPKSGLRKNVDLTDRRNDANALCSLPPSSPLFFSAPFLFFAQEKTLSTSGEGEERHLAGKNGLLFLLLLLPPVSGKLKSFLSENSKVDVKVEDFL